MKLVTTLICAVVLCLSASDYHARQGKDGDLRYKISAAKWSLEQEHYTQLIEELSRRIAGAVGDERYALMRLAYRVARRDISIHPRDPEAWTKYAEVLLMVGKPYKAYSAISRATTFDPTHIYIRGLHAQIARAVGDKPGYDASLRIYLQIKQAEQRQYQEKQ